MKILKPHRTRIDGKFTHLQLGQEYEPSAWELRAYPDRFGEQFSEPTPNDSIQDDSEDSIYTAPDIEEYTTRELIQVAQDHHVAGYSGLRKEELFALVKAYL